MNIYKLPLEPYKNYLNKKVIAKIEIYPVVFIKPDGTKQPFKAMPLEYELVDVLNKNGKNYFITNFYYENFMNVLVFTDKEIKRLIE